MALWITVYCRFRREDITAAQLLDGIHGRDLSALAGVDYESLAEDYHVHLTSVADAVAALAVRPLADGAGCEVRYGAEARPLFVRRWRETARVAEEIREVVERAASYPREAVERVRSSCEVIGIELGVSHLRDMGVVVAYEVARYLAQKCDGVILTDEGRWLRVDDGEFANLD
jgi:hypothetical protein